MKLNKKGMESAIMAILITLGLILMYIIINFAITGKVPELIKMIIPWAY